MAKFKIDLLTTSLKNDNTYWLSTTMSEFYSQMDESSSARKENNMFNEQNTFCYTFDEQFQISQNGQKTLSFSMLQQINGQLGWEDNPFIKNIHNGSFILLTDKYNNQHLMIVKNIEITLSEVNNTYQYTCQDAFTYQLIRQNDGYEITNDPESEDYIGAKDIDWWAVNKIVPECSIHYNYILLKDGLYLNQNDEVIKYNNSNKIENLNKIIKKCYTKEEFPDLYEQFPFSASGSNADAVLISLGEKIGLILNIYERLQSTPEGDIMVTYFWFEPSKNNEVTGIKYSPEQDIKDLSISFAGDSLTTVLNVNAVEQADDSLVTLLHELPTFFASYIADDATWNSSIYYQGMYSDIIEAQNHLLTTEVTDQSDLYCATGFGGSDNFASSLSQLGSALYNQMHTSRESPALILYTPTTDDDGNPLSSSMNYVVIPVWDDVEDSGEGEVVDGETKPIKDFSLNFPIFYNKVSFEKQVGEQAGFINVIGNDWGLNLTTSNANLELVLIDDNKQPHFYNGFKDIESSFLGRRNIAAIRCCIMNNPTDIIEIQLRMYLSFTRDTNEEEREFAKIADSCPWLENKLINFNYYYDNNIINKYQYNSLMNTLYNDLRIINGKLLLYSKQYYAGLHQQTQIEADLLTRLESLGGAFNNSVVTQYESKGGLSDLSGTDFDNGYNSLFIPPQTQKVIYNYDNLLSQYFTKTFNEQQYFYKYIYQFEDYFNKPVASNSEGVFEDIITLVDPSEDDKPAEYFVTFSNNNEDILEKINDNLTEYYDNSIESETYGKPFQVLYDKDGNPVEIAHKGNVTDYYTPENNNLLYIQIKDGEGIYKKDRLYYGLGFLSEESDLDLKNVFFKQTYTSGLVSVSLIKFERNDKYLYIIKENSILATQLTDDSAITDAAGQSYGKVEVQQLTLTEIEYIWLIKHPAQMHQYYVRDSDCYIDLSNLCDFKTKNTAWRVNGENQTDSIRKSYDYQDVVDKTHLHLYKTSALIGLLLEMMGLDAFNTDFTKIPQGLPDWSEWEKAEQNKDGYTSNKMIWPLSLLLIGNKTNYIYYYGKKYRQGSYIQDNKDDTNEYNSYYLLNTYLEDYNKSERPDNTPLYDYQAVAFVNDTNCKQYASRVIGVAATSSSSSSGVLDESQILDKLKTQGAGYFSKGSFKVGNENGLGDFFGNPMSSLYCFNGFSDELQIRYANNVNSYSQYINFQKNEQNWEKRYYNYYKLLAPTFSGIGTLQKETKTNDPKSGFFVKGNSFRLISKNNSITNGESYRVLLDTDENFSRYLTSYDEWLETATNEGLNSINDAGIPYITYPLNTINFNWQYKNYVNLASFVETSLKNGKMIDDYRFSFTLTNDEGEELSAYGIIIKTENYTRKDFDINSDKITSIYNKATDEKVNLLLESTLTNDLFTEDVAYGNWVKATTIGFDIDNGKYFKQIDGTYINIPTIKQAGNLYIYPNLRYTETTNYENTNDYSAVIYLNHRILETKQYWILTIKDKVQRNFLNTIYGTKWAVRWLDSTQTWKYLDIEATFNQYEWDAKNGESTYKFLVSDKFIGYYGVVFEFGEYKIEILSTTDDNYTESTTTKYVVKKVETTKASDLFTFHIEKKDGTYIHKDAYYEDGVSYPVWFVASQNSIYKIKGLTNGSYWWLFHNLIDNADMHAIAMNIETELTSLWSSAYAHSLYCDYFIPENWQPIVDGLVNNFSQLLFTTSGSAENGDFTIKLNSRFIPQVKVVWNGNTNKLAAYDFYYNNCHLVNISTTQQQEVMRDSSVLLSNMDFENPAITDVVRLLKEDNRLQKWTAVENGTRTYYYNSGGGMRWGDLVTYLSPSNFNYTEYSGIYVLFYRLFKDWYKNVNNNKYENYLEKQKVLWNKLYKQYPGIILESSYTDDDATTSTELFTSAQLYMKDMSQPERQYNISIIDMNQLKGYEGQELKIGDGIELDAEAFNNDELSLRMGLLQYLFITDISYKLRSDDELSLTVNAIKYQDKIIQQLVKLIR